MGISEFTLHNVLRTYSRQERLGGIHKAKARAGAPGSTADRVSLSPSGRKIQWIGNLATEMVDTRHPDLSAEDKTARVRNEKRELLARHGDEIGRDDVSPEAFETRLRELYLG